MLCTASPLHSVLYCTVSSHRVSCNKTQMPQEVKETKSRVFTRHLTPTTPPSLTTCVREPWSIPVWSARWESFTTSVTEKYTKPPSTYCVVVHSKHDKQTNKQKKRSTQVKTNARNNLRLPRVVWSVSSKQLTSLRRTHWRTACSSVCWCVTWWRTARRLVRKRWYER